MSLLPGKTERSRWKLPATFVVAALVMSGCGGESGGSGEGSGGGEEGSSAVELNLGTIMPLTGDLAAVGPSMENAANLAAKQVNQCDAVKINMSNEDEGTDPQTAATAADKLINTDDVGAIIGAAASRSSFAVIDPAAQSSVTVISPSSTSPDFTDYEDNGYFFRTVPSDNLQAVAISNIADQEGYETMNILALNDDYGQGIADTFEGVYDGEIGANVAYDPSGTSFDSETQQVASGDPDAILLVGFPETGTSIMQSFEEQGALGEVPILITDGLSTEEFPPELTDSGIQAEEVRGTRPYSQGAGTEFYTGAYNDEYDEDPGIFSANTYDAVMLAALAAAAADGGEGSDIQENLQDVSEGGKEVTAENICSALDQAANGDDIDYQGAAGSQDVDDNGDVTSDYELLEIQGDELNQVDVISAPEPAGS